MRAKFASVIGPLIFATVDDVTGSTRFALVSLSLLFVADLVVLWQGDVAVARSHARERSVDDG